MSGTKNGRSPRSVALVGPYSSGKSTLFEALLDAAGSPVKRPADPRNRPMTTEIRLGHCSYLGDPWSILDCPGSIEFAHQTCSRPGDGRYRRRGMRADAGQGRHGRAAAEDAEGRRRSPYRLHQQDRHAGRQHRRHAGRLAGLCRQPAGAAADADLRRPDRHRLCRSHERAGLPLPQGPGLGTDADPRRDAGRRAGRAGPPGGNAGRPRRRAAGESAGGREADARGTLPRHAQGPAGRRGDRGPGRRRGTRQRRAAAVEGAAPRHARSGRNRRTPGDRCRAARRVAQVFKTAYAGHTGKLSYARIWRGTIIRRRATGRHAPRRNLSLRQWRTDQGPGSATRRHRGARAAGWRAHRRHRVARRAARTAALPGSRPRRSMRWRSPPPTARTT